MASTEMQLTSLLNVLKSTIATNVLFSVQEKSTHKMDFFFKSLE